MAVAEKRGGALMVGVKGPSAAQREVDLLGQTAVCMIVWLGRIMEG